MFDLCTSVNFTQYLELRIILKKKNNVEKKAIELHPVFIVVKYMNTYLQTSTNITLID